MSTPAQSDQEATIASRDGTPIAVSRSGHGPPIVLVHGTTGDRDSHRLLAPHLARQFTVHAIDRRGRGHSGDAEGYSIEREFEDVAAVVDSIGAPATLYGHSYGANCALGAALLTPNVRKMVLYEPDTAEIPVPEPILEGLQDMIDDGRREEALVLILQGLVGLKPEELEAMRAAPTWPSRVAAVHTVPRELRAQGEGWFRPERFADVRVPTLLLVGSESPDWAKRGTGRVAEALPDSRIVELAGQGHAAAGTAPRLLASEIARFALDEQG